MRLGCRLTDLTAYIADTTTVHVSGLETFQAIVSNTGPSNAESCTMTSLFLDALLSNTKNLAIHLRLPLADLETPETSHGTPTQNTCFANLPTALSKMPHLHTLTIWLDHDQPTTWSIINERVLLSPLATFSLKSPIQVLLDLPKLNPAHETPKLHYISSAELPSNFRIHRRQRQPYYSADGIEVQHAPDFPVLYHMCDFWKCTIEEIEDMERKEIEAGRDPMLIMEACIQFGEPRWVCGNI